MRQELQRITYIEDDADIRAVAQLALEDIGGYRLQSCASGSEAVATVAAFDPDFILLDHMMPGMDGIETFGKLRAQPSLDTTPIAFMTALAAKEGGDRYRALGAVGVIWKPFDPITLAADVEALWRQAQLSEIPS